MIARRGLARLILGGGAAIAAAPVLAKTKAAPPDHPEPPASARAARLIWTRLVADLSGRPVFFFTHGTVWGFKPQAEDLTVDQFARRLYGYSGVAARQLVAEPGGGYRLHQKFWAFYRDPVSDAITDRIANPYTGRTDTAAPLSGPLSVKPLDLGPSADGAMPFAMRIRRLGPTATIETSAFARFQSKGTDWHKLEGNLEDYVCATADLDGRAPHVPSRYSQNVIAEWQTWTGMHGTPGYILFKGNGIPLRHLDEVPADQLAAIERFFPGTLAPVAGWR